MRRGAGVQQALSVDSDDAAIDDGFQLTTAPSFISSRTMDSLGLSALQHENVEEPMASCADVAAASAARPQRATDDLLIAAVSSSSSTSLISAFRHIRLIGDGPVMMSSVTFEWLMEVVCEDVERLFQRSVAEAAVLVDDGGRWAPHLIQQQFWKIVHSGYLLVKQQLLRYPDTATSATSDPLVWRSMLKFAALVVDLDLAVRCIDALTLLNAVMPRDALIAAIASARCERLDVCDRMLQLMKRSGKEVRSTVMASPNEMSDLLSALHEITVLAFAVPPSATQVQDLAGQLSRLLAMTDAGVLPPLASAVGNACGGLLAKSAQSVSFVQRNRDTTAEQQHDDAAGVMKDTMGDPVRLVDSLVHALLDHSSEACIRQPVVLEGLLHALSCSPLPASSRVASLAALLFRQANKAQLSVATVVDRFLCESTAQASLDQLDNSTRVGLGALPSAVDTVAVRLYLSEAPPSLFFSALALAATDGPPASLVFARERHYAILVTGVVGILDAMTPPPSHSQVVDAVLECVRRAPTNVIASPMSPPTKVALQRLKCWLWSVEADPANHDAADSLDTLMSSATSSMRNEWCVSTTPIVTVAQIRDAETQPSCRLLVLDDAVFSWAAEACSSTTALGGGWTHWSNVVDALMCASSVARTSTPPGSRIVLLSDQVDVLTFCFGALHARQPVLSSSTVQLLRTAEQMIKTLGVCDLAASARIRWLQQSGSPVVQVLAQTSPPRSSFGSCEDAAGCVFTAQLRDPALPKDAFESALPRLHAEGRQAVGSNEDRRELKWSAETPESLLAANLGMMIC
jgi:hypothetical protein